MHTCVFEGADAENDIGFWHTPLDTPLDPQSACADINQDFEKKGNFIFVKTSRFDVSNPQKKQPKHHNYIGDSVSEAL